MKKEIRIGTSGWTYDDWRGKFYPKELSKKNWLNYYSKIFSTVELNATFYRGFSDLAYQSWYQQVPKNFKFIIKVHRYITHRKFLLAPKESIIKVCNSASLLQERLGLMLLQVAPQTPYDLARLEKTLSLFPDPSKVAVEFRAEKWLTPETFKLLKKFKAVFCTADSPKTVLQNIVTSTTSYIRLHGTTKWYDYHYSYKELENIADLVHSMQQQGAKLIYIFFDNDVKARAPKNALTLQEILEG